MFPFARCAAARWVRRSAPQSSALDLSKSETTSRSAPMTSSPLRKSRSSPAQHCPSSDILLRKSPMPTASTRSSSAPRWATAPGRRSPSSMPTMIRASRPICCLRQAIRARPLPKLTKVNETGGTTDADRQPELGMEISLDVEWAHADGPGANILLVEANTSGLPICDGGELRPQSTRRECRLDELGGQRIQWPAVVRLLFHDARRPHWRDVHRLVRRRRRGGQLARGQPECRGRRRNDALGYQPARTRAKRLGAAAAAERVRIYSTPSYQVGVQTTGHRTVPDVSFDANPSTGFAVYDTAGGSARLGCRSAAPAPVLRNGRPWWPSPTKGAPRAIQAALSGTDTNLYSLSASDFHDITSGSNGAYTAKAGYDEVTGRGSPYANLVVRDLVNATFTTPSAPVYGPRVIFIPPLPSTAGGNSITGAGGSDFNSIATSISTDPSTIVGATSLVTNAASNSSPIYFAFVGLK